MKNIILLIIFFTTLIQTLSAQHQMIHDALSISMNNYHLTARSTAMGGASGAMKSDMSAIVINPAAIATYKTGEVLLTPVFYTTLSKSDYRDYINPVDQYYLAIRNAGIVYTLSPKKSTARYNLGLAYNRLNTFDTRYSIEGLAPINESYWTEIAGILNSNRNATVIDPQLEEWGPNSKLFETKGAYVPIAKNDIRQSTNITISGFVNEYTLSFGTNLSEKLHLGISAVMRDAKKSTISLLQEEEEENTDNAYRREEYTDISGMGFGAKMGVLIYPVPEFTIGVAIHSPVFYSINQNYRQRIYSLKKDGSRYLPNDATLDYLLMTPLQATLSLNYVFTDYAQISFDYEAVPYSLIYLSRFKGEALHPDNNMLRDESKYAHNLRLGTEVNILKNISIRAGVAYSSAASSFEKGSVGFATGLGYSFGDALIDASYMYYIDSRSFTLYPTSLSVNSIRTMNLIMLTLAYRF